MTDEELVQTLIGEVLTQYEADSILKSIGNLKSENDELKSRLTHATEECLKWHERAQNLLKDSGGSISGYEKKISDLQAENAALRERLSKAVEFPIKCGDYVYDILDGTAYKTEVIELKVNIHGDLWCRTVSSYFPLELLGKRIFLTKEAAEAKLKELQGGKE